ncbi:MAG TPA: FAD-binding oxidoreductase, partial [Paracoccaceae bacterium]|nr:FAD-binding oxidoreductase [Paracoccaceae bacterium]
KAWIATTPAGKVTAPRVIMATNGHARSFGLFRGRLAHVYTFASMTRELTRGEIGKLGGQLEWGLTPADPLGATVRRTSGTGGDRIVIRSRFTYEPSMEVDPAKLDGIWATHNAGFAARFPMLPDMKMEYRWGGHLCLSRNNVPAFGEVKPGLFSACCQNGLGTVKGTLHGMLAAELALGESSDALTSVLALPKPKLLPPPPIARLGATAKIRWGEWRAGREI